MYINLFPPSGLMQLNTGNLLWRRGTLHHRARVSVSERRSEDPGLGDSATGRSVDESLEGAHLPLAITLQPTIPTTSIGDGTDTVQPPTGTGVPISSTGTGDESLTTSTSSAAPESASTTSPTPAANSTSSLQTPTPSSQGDPTAAGRSSSKMAGKSLSGGAVAGIVIAVLSIILVIGILVYRKRAIKRRGRMRRTWLPRPFVVETTTTVVTDAPNALEKGAKRLGEAAGSSASGGSGTNGGGTLPPSGARTIPRVKPPPLSLLSIPGLLASAGPDSGSKRANGAAGRRLSSMSDLAEEDAQDGLSSGKSLLLSQTHSAPLGGRPHPGALTNIGVVRCIFEPSMPDELKIRVGEAMRILAEYDDGWGLCENLRGERGVVPLQCLDRGMGEDGGTSESSRPPSGRRTAIGL